MRDIKAVLATFGPSGEARRLGVLHRLGIALISLSLFGILARLEIVAAASFRLDLGMAVIFIITLYLIVVDWRLGLGVFGISLLLYIAASAVPLVGNAVLLLLGSLAQLTGHGSHVPAVRSTTPGHV